MRLHRFFICLIALTMCCVISVQAEPPSFTTLQPGQFLEINQTLQINIVFVGYSTFAPVNQSIFRPRLPATTRAINRIPTGYLGSLEFTGNRFSFVYNIRNSTAQFDNAFFAYLNSIGTAAPLTEAQKRYNQQPNRSLTIGQNYQIDSLLTEKWLAENAESMLGINTHTYTIFFVNWFGRSDFRFHVYAPTKEYDVDTGINVGQGWFNQAISAGGTPPDDPETPLGSLRRVWFVDLSAGPELTTTNWDLTRADIDGDGRLDYRMPPIWEYGSTSGYRPFNTYSSDHARIARYVAIDLLFTTSPLYRVLLSPIRQPTEINIDINLYEGDPLLDGKTLLHEGAVQSKLTSLRPTNHFSTDVTELAFDGLAKQVLDCFHLGTNCYGNRFPASLFMGDLYLYHSDRLFQFLDGNADYEIPFFAYLTTDFYADGFYGGAAISNYLDGTQTHVYDIFPDVYLQTSGFGLTSNSLHEFGHHLGLSHPHDGIDWEQQFAFGPSGSFFFAWAGDTSSTVMGYNGNNEDFSQFDRDNMSRFLTAGYINQANAILSKILRSPQANEVNAYMMSGDVLATAALAAYQNMDYLDAAAQSKAAYEQILLAASAAHIPLEKQAWPAEYRERSRFEGTSATNIDDRRSIDARR